MEKFIKGDVVVIPFPFSDLSMSKRRPALVLTNLDGDDLILCQITSQSVQDRYAIHLTDDEFDTGNLHKPSNIRPNRLFTADRHIVLYKTGSLQKGKINTVINAVVKILSE